MTAAGVLALDSGLFGGLDSGLPLVGLGAALTFLGVAIFSPMVARPLARVIGAPMQRLGRISWKLGPGERHASPRRTAATASALMIGLGLVGTVSVLAASIQKSSTASSTSRWRPTSPSAPTCSCRALAPSWPTS